MKPETIKTVAILCFVASILAFAAALVEYLRHASFNYTALGGGVVLAVCGVYARSLSPRRPAS